MSVSLTINRYLGAGQEALPPSAVVLTLKICESCGYLFLRPNHDRYCFACHASPEPLKREVTLSVLEELFETERPLPL